MPRRQSSTPLLSPQERKTCESLSVENIAMVSQRAKTLLLINDGKTHAEAVQETGLTIGQVRYAVNRFRKIGMAMFSNTSIKKEPEKPAAEKQIKKTEKKAKKKKATSKKSKKTKKISSKTGGKKKDKKSGKKKKKK